MSNLLLKLIVKILLSLRVMKVAKLISYGISFNWKILLETEDSIGLKTGLCRLQSLKDT